MKTVLLIVSCLVAVALLLVSCAPAITENDEVVTEEPKILTDVYRSGQMKEDETWSGTVHITGDIWVDSEVTITILPGTKVLFTAHKDGQHGGFPVMHDEWTAANNDPTVSQEWEESHISMDVYGTLIARGTPDNMITFTSDSQTPDGGDWFHLHIGPESIVEYCIIEYSKGGIDVMINTGDSILISHNIIRHNLWTALSIHEGSFPTVTYNVITHNGAHQGIAIGGWSTSSLIANNEISHCKLRIAVGMGDLSIIENNVLVDNDCGMRLKGSPVIRNNSISSPNGAQYNFTYQGTPVYFAAINQGQYGGAEGILVVNSSPTITNNRIFNYPRNIAISGDSSPIISQNSIMGGENGITFDSNFAGSPKINENNIYDHEVNIGLQPGFNGLIDTINNWWGTTVVADIEYKIRDSRHGPSLGTVVYEPLLTQPVETE